MTENRKFHLDDSPASAIMMATIGLQILLNKRAKAKAEAGIQEAAPSPAPEPATTNMMTPEQIAERDRAPRAFQRRLARELRKSGAKSG